MKSKFIKFVFWYVILLPFTMTHIIYSYILNNESFVQIAKVVWYNLIINEDEDDCIDID